MTHRVFPLRACGYRRQHRNTSHLTTTSSPYLPSLAMQRYAGAQRTPTVCECKLYARGPTKWPTTPWQCRLHAARPATWPSTWSNEARLATGNVFHQTNADDWGNSVADPAPRRMHNCTLVAAPTPKVGVNTSLSRASHDQLQEAHGPKWNAPSACGRI